MSDHHSNPSIPDSTEAPPLIGELDVVVIGGGPGGASCALALRTHMPSLGVGLVEASSYDNVRLGENVSSALLPLLDYLGARDTFLAQAAHVESFTVQACWGTSTPLPQHSLRHWSGEGYLLDRHRFDVMLAENFHARGGKLYLSCRVEEILRAEAGEPGYLLHLRHESGARFALKARFLVDATGRKASIARRLGASSLQYDSLIGVSRYFEMDPAIAWPRDIVIESAADGWWYSAPLPDDRLVLTWMTDAALWRDRGQDRLGAWQSLLARAPNSYARVHRAAVAADPTLTVRQAHTQILDQAAGTDWLAVGDAAASFDPLSSLGIGFAMHSACHAARAIASTLAGQGGDSLRHYSDSVRRQFSGYLPTWRSYYGYETRFPGAPFWQARRVAEHEPAAHEGGVHRRFDRSGEAAGVDLGGSGPRP